MNQVREYGLLAAIVMIGVAGYVLYYNHRADILEYSLDVLEERTLSLIADPGSRQLVAERFSEFRDRVEAREVEPSRVENIAANVLNLSHRGAKLTPDQVEVILNPEREAAFTLPSPAPHPPKAGIPPDHKAGRSAVIPGPFGGEGKELADLGERLHKIIVLDKKLMQAAGADPEKREKLMKHVVYRCEDGLQIKIDSDVRGTVEAIKTLEKEIQALEKEKVLVWQRDLTEQMAREQDELSSSLDSLAAMHVEMAGVAEGLGAAMAALQSLGREGYRPAMNVDSLREEVLKQLKESRVYVRDPADRSRKLH